jgi:hypothetical protein
VGSSSILVKNSYLDINKKNRNDQEPGTILTGIFTEKGFINKNVSLKKIIPKNDEEPNGDRIIQFTRKKYITTFYTTETNFY